MFWAPPKYKPRTVEFNPDTITHETFVKSFSSILATVLGVNSDSDTDLSSCKKKPKTLEGAEEHNPSKRVCHMHHIQSRNTSTSFGPPRASMCRKLWQSAPLHQREENGLPGKSYLPSRQQRLLSRVLWRARLLRPSRNQPRVGPCATLSWTWGYRCSRSASPQPHSVSVSRTLCIRPFRDSWSYKDAFNGPKLGDFISFFEKKKLGLTLIALS